MPVLAFALEDAQQPAHRRGRRRVGKFSGHLRRGGTTQPVDHVHDLPFTAA
jgi:hypothetical protein